MNRPVRMLLWFVDLLLVLVVVWMVVLWQIEVGPIARTLSEEGIMPLWISVLIWWAIVFMVAFLCLVASSALLWPDWMTRPDKKAAGEKGD